jgi:hypothetical protein
VLILVSVAILFAALIVVELAARWWVRYRNEYYVFAPGSRIVLNLDQTALPGFAPVHININREGERGPELPADRTSLYRVLVAGGSATECCFLDQPESWPGVMQAILEKPENLARLGTAKVHVGNIGRSSVAGEALRLMFEKVLPRMDNVNAIVIMVGASAVLSWMEQGTPSPPKCGDLDLNEYFMKHPSHPFSFSPRHMALIELARRVRDKSKPVKVRDGVGKWLIKARQMRRNAPDLRTATPDPAPVIDNFVRYFDESVRLAKQKASRVIIITQPWFQKKTYSAEEEALFWNGGSGDVITQDVKTFYSHQVIFDLMKRIEDVVLTSATKHGVESFNVRTGLEASRENYYDHFHFTPIGSAKVAQMICDIITQRPASS